MEYRKVKLSLKQRLFTTGDKKRYGLKYNKADKFWFVIVLLFLVSGLVWMFHEEGDWKRMFLGLGLAWFGLYILGMNDKDIYKRRIKELGGDTFYERIEKP
jgi:hypothetical protein